MAPETSGGGEDLEQAHTPTAGIGDGARPVGEDARARWAVFLVLAAVVVVLDQLTKAWITASIQPGESIRVVDDLLRLIHTRNTGALFGLFRDSALVFGLVSVVVLGVILLYHHRSAPNRYLTVALGLLFGGAVGNLVDRLRLGHVVDFVDMGIGDLRWYTFNVADAAITGAIALLLLVAVVPGLAAQDGGGVDD